MGRLTEKDRQGNWHIKGLPWKDTYKGQVITENTREKTYGAFRKLLDYEETGLTPEQVQQLKDKNTAERPTFEGDGCDQEGNIILDEWLCPHCNTRYEVDYDRYFYCPNCGQKIRWSEEDE